MTIKRQHEEEEANKTTTEEQTKQEEEPANKMQKPNEQNSSSSSEQTPVVVQQVKSRKLPVTVLTGFLGAGKSTLLNYILSQNHGYRIAIIENEFGEVSIDDALIVTSKEEVVELSNGCLCCTLRGDLIGALTKLSQKKDKFDYICIETTGLALPGPIVQTFYLDEQVRNEYYLDGIVTVVDSKHIIQHLHHHHHEKKHGEEEEDEEEEENEAEDQVAFADRIIVNKVDLIDEDTKKKVLKKIRKINGLSPICETSHSKIDLSFILNIRAFDIDRVLNMDPNLLKEMDEHQHEEDHHHHKHDHHDAEVTSYAIVKPGVVDKEKFEDWLLDLLTERGLDIYRTKGFLNVREAKPLVVQAVHSLLDMRFFGEWKNNDTTNKLVFIGKYLDHEELLQGFNECLKQ